VIEPHTAIRCRRASQRFQVLISATGTPQQMDKEGKRRKNKKLIQYFQLYQKQINPKAIPCLAMRNPLNMDLYLLCNNIHHTVAIEKFTLVQ
jgi:hypothetical protein